MEISIDRSPQHWFQNEGSNSELFDHKNDAITARSQMMFCTLNSSAYDNLEIHIHNSEKGYAQTFSNTVYSVKWDSQGTIKIGTT